MPRGFRRFICRAFWLEPDQPAAYYREVFFGVGFIVSGTVALVFGLTGRTSHPAFWSSVIAAVGMLAVATNKRAIIAGALFFAAIRFGVAFAFSGRVVALLIAAVLYSTAIAILKTAPR